MTRIAMPVRAGPRASAGMRAYARALLDGLPRTAPDLQLVAVDAPAYALPFALRRARAQLLHLPFPDVVPLVPRPYTAMLHDLIHLRFPRLFSPATAAFWALAGGPLYRGAARVLVSDPRVADDCVELLGVRRERVRVVPLGYDPVIPAAPPWRAARPYLFYAGNHRAHKGLDTLYAAWRDLPARLEVDLVLTGADEPAARARYTRRNGTLAFVGELSADELAGRYRGALAYVQPSLAEGFGIPALEAAAAGTPVVASRSSVPAPVAPYAHLFEAGDARALCALLESIVREPAGPRALAAEGAVGLRAYTWDRFAAGTAAVLREVVCS